MKVRRPINNPYKIVKMFEEEVAEYTGAPYAVAVDSCTNALFLSLKYIKYLDKKNHELANRPDSVIDTQPLDNEIIIPSKTYLSVPMSIIHAGFEPVFDSSVNDWSGIYQLKPYPIYDSAKRLTSNMYIEGSFMCLSFHMKKTLAIGKGGMILTDNPDAVVWLKKARYEGRSEVNYKEDNIDMLGWNMYITPQAASHGLALMQNYPVDVPDLGENDGYRDLTEFKIFEKYKKI
jgi:dTDP-4-amino-4,6-dideoxygalactose transaminase